MLDRLGLRTPAAPPHQVHAPALRNKTSAHIPYACHYDDNIVMTRNNALLLTIKISGLPFETADAQELVYKKNLRNNLLRGLASSRHAAYVHTIRRRQSVYPGGVMPPGFADRLNRDWREHYQKMEMYVNDIYLTLVMRPRLAGKAGLVGMIDAMSRNRDEKERKLWLADQARELHEMAQAAMVSLGDYSPERLGIFEQNGLRCSTVLSFLSYLINGEYRTIRVPDGDLATHLPYKRIIFGTDAYETRGTADTRVSAILAVKSYPDSTAHDMMDRFLTVPVEMIICQSFIFSDMPPAMAAMKEQRRRMEQVSDDAESQIAEIGDALDDLASGRIAYGYHHLTIQVKAPTLRELENHCLPLVSNTLMSTTAIAVREDLCMEASHWAQLPGNFKYIPRPSMISSANFASFASLHNYGCGTLVGNHWGHAVTMLETISGTPYYYNWHVADVGHTAIVAPTGTGKSALNNFLLTMSTKFSPRIYFFDKDFGAYPFVKASHGVHATISKSECSGFNPLQLQDTDLNRSFLQDWLELMLTAHGETLTAAETEMITEAITVNYQLDPAARTLRNIAPAFGKIAIGSTRNRIEQWIGEGAYAGLFDNDDDRLTLDKHLYGFEMGGIIDDERALPPVVAYLFHRIRLSLDGSPVIIVLEEGAKLISNHHLLAAMENWLQTIRKLNGMVVFLSPDPASLYKHSDSLIKQTTTQIYLANSKATREEYVDKLHLSDGEFETVRNLNASERVFLIKHARDSVLARLDLTPVKWAIPLLSGRPEHKQTIDDLIALAGTDDPDAWLDDFIAAYN